MSRAPRQTDPLAEGVRAELARHAKGTPLVVRELGRDANGAHRYSLVCVRFMRITRGGKGRDVHCEYRDRREYVFVPLQDVVRIGSWPFANQHARGGGRS